MSCTAPRLLRQAGLLRLGRRRPLSSTARVAVAESGSAPPVMVERRPVAKGGEVAVITLNRPKHMNALTSDMITELQAQLEAVGRDQDVRAIIIQGAGGNFCGGHDLRQIHEQTQQEGSSKRYFEEFFARCSRFMVSLQRVPHPVIASVRGIATGAGCQLVAACDMAVASSDSRFATSGVKLGLFCSTPSVPLSRNVSRKRAFEMLVTGDFIDARTAQDWGLVNRVVPAERLEKEVSKLVESICAKPAVTIAHGKRLFYSQLDKPQVVEAYTLADMAMAANLMEREAEEGIAAFVQKRSPHWGSRPPPPASSSSE